MKKLIFPILALIAIIYLTNCKGTESKESDTSTVAEPVVEYTKEYGNVQHHYNSETGNIRDGRYFNFNGHSYIQFDIWDQHGGYAIVHDPDCPCMKSSNQ